MSISLFAFKRNRRTIKWSCVVLLVSFICLIGVSVYSISQGGLTSEQLIGRGGTSDSNLVINRSGTNGSLDIGFSGVISSAWVSDIGLGTAKLHGNLTALNGMPTSEVYFVWGYDGVNFPNETARQAKSLVGGFDTDIAFDPTQHVYFMPAVQIDGINYGPLSDFASMSSGASGSSIAWYLMWYLAPMILVVFAVAVVWVARKSLIESIWVIFLVCILIVVIRAVLMGAVD